jgi:transcriptional regulator with XRE-family HTH domain
MFGEYVKQKRLELNLSLRKFCKMLDEDPSNWSKIERKVLAPPQNEEKLKKIAEVLKIKIGSPEWKELNHFANVDAGIIPDYIMSDEKVIQSLPAFFRTVGNVKPTKKEIEELIRSLKNGK